MAKGTQKRMGRPPGSEFPHLLHVRISDEMKLALGGITGRRMDRPSTAQLAREAFSMLIEREAKSERRK